MPLSTEERRLYTREGKMTTWSAMLLQGLHLPSRWQVSVCRFLAYRKTRTIQMQFWKTLCTSCKQSNSQLFSLCHANLGLANQFHTIEGHSASSEPIVCQGFGSHYVGETSLEWGHCIRDLTFRILGSNL